MTITSPTVNDHSQHGGLILATPRDITVMGILNIGDAWEVIKVFRGLDVVTQDSWSGVPRDLSFEDNTTFYNRYRVVIEKTNHASTDMNGDKFSWATIGNWGLYGDDAHEALYVHGDNSIVDNTAVVYARMN